MSEVTILMTYAKVKIIEKKKVEKNFFPNMENVVLLKI